MAGSEELSGSLRTASREGGRAQGEWETMAQLTAVAEVASACSGKHWSERGGERDLRRWEVEDDDVEALGASGVAQLDEEEEGY